MWDINKNTKLDDLRLKDDDGTSGVLFLASEGRFDEVLKLLKQDKSNRLSVADLTERNNLGLNVIMELGWQKSLDLLFHISLWTNRINDLKELWSNIPDNFKEQISYEETYRKIQVDMTTKTSVLRPERRRSKPF